MTITIVAFLLLAKAIFFIAVTVLIIKFLVEWNKQGGHE